MASDISVVICAYTEERWDELLAAVHSVQQQSQPPLEIIVVVDHNPELLNRLRTALPDIRAIDNTASVGLSGARNTGITAAKGQKIAFLDDDATADADWLKLLGDWCNQPDVMGAGGKAEPAWQGSFPRWFPKEFYWVIGCSYKGMPTTAEPVRNPFGCSMCIERKVFEVVGGFREDVGRVGKIALGCEETELCIRVRQRWPNAIFMYEPKTVINHQVPDQRTRWAYFRQRCFAEGFSKALISQFVGSNDALSAERTYTMRILPLGVLRGLRDAFLRQDWAGLARAGSIIAGLLITAAGYGYGSLVLGMRARKSFVDIEAPSVK